jgi:hypothetical protein
LVSDPSSHRCRAASPERLGRSCRPVHQPPRRAGAAAKIAHVWDASAVSALDAITAEYAKRGEEVGIVGLNRPSAELHGDLSGNLASGR